MVLLEPDDDHFRGLEEAAVLLRARFSNVEFVTVHQTLESFLADPQWAARRFRIIVSSQVYYYPDNPEGCYRELQRRLTQGGRQIISLHMPNVGMNGLHAELVQRLGYPEFTACMHMMMICQYARSNGDPYRLAVEWADFNATSVADGTDEDGSLLSFALYQDVLDMEAELLAECRRTFLLRTYIDPADGVTRVFSQPVGILTAYGPECTFADRTGLWLPGMA